MEYMVCSWWLWIQGPARVVTKGHKVLRVYHGIGPYINRPELPPPLWRGGGVTNSDGPSDGPFFYAAMVRPQGGWSVALSDPLVRC